MDDVIVETCSATAINIIEIAQKFAGAMQVCYCCDNNDDDNEGY